MNECICGYACKEKEDICGTCKHDTPQAVITACNVTDGLYGATLQNGDVFTFRRAELQKHPPIRPRFVRIYEAMKRVSAGLSFRWEKVPGVIDVRLDQIVWASELQEEGK